VLAVRRVEVVFDAVVAAPGQLLSDVRPLVAQTLVQIENLAFFVSANGVFLNVGVQVIVPALTALFARPPADLVLLFQFLRHVGPAFSPVRGHQLYDRVVFLHS
jgi:hypothetical protein